MFMTLPPHKFVCLHGLSNSITFKIHADWFNSWQEEQTLSQLSFLEESLKTEFWIKIQVQKCLLFDLWHLQPSEPSSDMSNRPQNPKNTNQFSMSYLHKLLLLQFLRIFILSIKNI